MSYKEAFPDFDMGHECERLIALGFDDTSWANDACPFMTKGRGQIAIDYSPQHMQIIQGQHVERVYCVYELDEEGAYRDASCVDCRTLEEAIAAVDRINGKVGSN